MIGSEKFDFNGVLNSPKSFRLTTHPAGKKRRGGWGTKRERETVERIQTVRIKTNYYEIIC